MTDLAALTVDDFAATIGTDFAVDAGATDPVALRLTRADPAVSTPGAPRPGFSLEFLGPAEPLLPQATFAVEHPTLGALPLFLVPIGRDADGSRYQAVFA